MWNNKSEGMIPFIIQNPKDMVLDKKNIVKNWPYLFMDKFNETVGMMSSNMYDNFISNNCSKSEDDNYTLIMEINKLRYAVFKLIYFAMFVYSNKKNIDIMQLCFIKNICHLFCENIKVNDKILSHMLDKIEDAGLIEKIRKRRYELFSGIAYARMMYGNNLLPLI